MTVGENEPNREFTTFLSVIITMTTIILMALLLIWREILLKTWSKVSVKLLNYLSMRIISSGVRSCIKLSKMVYCTRIFFWLW
ncbi:hypothetical protein HMPREF0580_2028 [Mobiluncus mulieris ATCC 35239]|uniref:Uncharacterized protein n=1 Tax=Mobiluncus mulieris ATCC 35239 TaxID=871571 RepID=E0QT00_9ACTO|nr:hypothetical protein HMPREF0580_2028 [Mobiluncus mulieris ATCC 35239]